MNRVLQYIFHEVKEGRLSRPGAIELTRELRTQGSLESPSVFVPANGTRRTLRVDGSLHD
jgi:hypothetical protein